MNFELEARHKSSFLGTPSLVIMLLASGDSTTHATWEGRLLAQSDSGPTRIAHLRARGNLNLISFKKTLDRFSCSYQTMHDLLSLNLDI